MKLWETVNHAFQSILTVWKTWDLHGFVLASLGIQFFLFIVAPWRKRASHWILGTSIWCAYLLVQTIITRALITFTSNSVPNSQQPYLYTFWAVFLIMHFGGPDTITALSIEDNDLWSRSWADLLTQIGATGNVAVGVPLPFYQWPSFVVPVTLCTFLAGFIKAAERIWCFKNASLAVFQQSLVPARPNPGPDYAVMVREYRFYKKHRLPVKFDDILPDEVASNSRSDSEAAGGLAELNHAQLVKQAYYFYNKFRGMYVDMLFCCHDRYDSRDIFLKLSPVSAFRVLETELKFAYDAFYTKMHLISNAWWVKIRLACFILEVVTLVMTLLWFKGGNHHFQPIEQFITWGLILWPVLGDICSFLWLQYRSDWKIALSVEKASPQVPNPMEQASTLSQNPSCYCCRHGLCSESTAQFNLINYCVDERSSVCAKLFTLIGANDMMESFKYVSRKCFPVDLKGFILKTLKESSLIAENHDIWEELSSSRGSWTLRYRASSDLHPATFEPWVMDTEYDESLLIWHVATELCYQTEGEPDDKVDEHRQFSKFLSDYMVYLFYKQPELMAEIAPMAKVIFQDTCAEAKRLFHRAKGSTSSSTEMNAGVIYQYFCTQARRLFHEAKGTEMKVKHHRQACKKIMDVRTDLASPREVKGQESMSVLFEACRLAKHLLHLKQKKVNHWEFISQIWVEFLCYTATHTPGAVHASLLCQGRQLVTLARLLTLHVGTSSQFRKEKKSPKSELVLDA